MMIKHALIVAGFALAASPAFATEWVYCNDATNTVTAGMLLGSERMAVAGIIMSFNDKVWASAAAYGPGDPIALGQGFEDDTVILCRSGERPGTTPLPSCACIRRAKAKTTLRAEHSRFPAKAHGP